MMPKDSKSEVKYVLQCMYFVCVCVCVCLCVCVRGNGVGVGVCARVSGQSMGHPYGGS